jgi:hypothetical protein
MRVRRDSRRTESIYGSPQEFVKPPEYRRFSEIRCWAIFDS